MAYDKITRNLIDGKLTIYDYNETHNVIVAIDEGDLAITVARPRRIVMSRGEIKHIRPGDQTPVEVAFTMQFSEFYTASDCTPYEILMREGKAATWLGTKSPDGVKQGPEDYTVKLKFVINDPGGGSDEKLEFNHFAVEQIRFAEGEEYSTLAVSGRGMTIKPTIAKV
jgi:hypothetical protein